jgi:uncharacterized protein YndB with AHSA1/START domain
MSPTADSSFTSSNPGTGGEPEDSRVILTSRVFPSPRPKVFNAFSSPELLAKWWGPEGFTNTFQEFDFRPGGRWKFVMHGPDGTDYPNESVFVEITEPDTLVLEHQGEHWFRATFLFEEIELPAATGLNTVNHDATRLTFRHVFRTAAHCDAIRDFVTVANKQNFDRLEAVLATSA